MDAIEIGGSAGSGAVVGWGIVRLIPWEAIDSKWRPLLAGFLAFGVSVGVGLAMSADIPALIVLSAVAAFGPVGANEAMKLLPPTQRVAGTDPDKPSP